MAARKWLKLRSRRWQNLMAHCFGGDLFTTYFMFSKNCPCFSLFFKLHFIHLGANGFELQEFMSFRY